MPATGNLRAESVQAHDREIDRLEWLVSAGHRWLRFPRDLEQAFVADYAATLLAYRRRVLLAAVLVLVAAGLLDLIFIGAALGQALWLRYGVALPLALVLLFFSRTRGFLAWQQPALAAFTLLMAALLFALMLVGGPEVVALYSPGFLLLAVFAGMLLHLRFWIALALLAVIGVAYTAFLVDLRPQPAETVITYTIYFATASLIALFASYHIEHAARRQFLQDRLLALKQGELEVANHQLQELVDQDGLTGVANRRHFDQQLLAEWSRARRNGQPLSLLLIDLDYFKNYNDTYGHQAGDDCLIVVGAVLRAHAQRSGDVAARYGGEEFAMILPSTGVEDAEEIAWRVVRDIAGYRIPHQASAIADVVTASAGVACFQPSPLLSPRDLLAAADEALYRAKRNGRNRVEVALLQPADRDQAAPASPSTAR